MKYSISTFHLLKFAVINLAYFQIPSFDHFTSLVSFYTPWKDYFRRGYRTKPVTCNGLICNEDKRTFIIWKRIYPAGIYLLKVNLRNTRKSCKICSKLTIKKPEQQQWCRSGVFIVNFEHISRITHCFGISIVNFEHVSLPWLVRLVNLQKCSLFQAFWEDAQFFLRINQKNRRIKITKKIVIYMFKWPQKLSDESFSFIQPSHN